MSETLKAQWLDFLQQVIPSDAPEIQVKEMRRAFYGGAWSMLQMTRRISADDEEIAVQALEAIAQECREFAAQIGTIKEGE